MRKSLITAVSALALMTGAAFAQSTTGSTAGGATGSGGTTTNSPTMQRSQDPAAAGTVSGQHTIASAEKLLGKNVYGKDNEKVGEVDDIILDPASGQAKQLILSSGGFLGIGDKKVAVDFNQAKWNEADNRLQLSTLSRDDVKNMSEFKYQDNMTSLNRNRDAARGDAANRGTTGTTSPAAPTTGTTQPKQ